MPVEEYEGGTKRDAVGRINEAEEQGDIETIVGIINHTMNLATCGGSRDDVLDAWGTVARSALDAFYRIMNSGSADSVELYSSEEYGNNYFDIIFFALDSWWDKNERVGAAEAIVESGLGCIVATCNNMDEIKSKFSGADLHEMKCRSMIIDIVALIVKKIMPKYQSEPSIQEQACLTLEVLAVSVYGTINNAIKESFQYYTKGEGYGFLKTQLVLARDVITNKQKKVYPGRVAKSLGISID